MSLPTATSSGPELSVASGRHEQVAEGDELAGVVRHLDADRRLARDRGEDAHVGGGHRVGDVLLQRRHPGDLHARAELELVAGDRRPDGHAGERRVDAVLLQRLLQDAAAGLDLGPVDRLGAGSVQQRDGRQRPAPGAGTVRRRRRAADAACGRTAPGAAGLRGTVVAVEVVGGVVGRGRQGERGGADVLLVVARHRPRRACVVRARCRCCSDDRSLSAWRAARPSGAATAPIPRPVFCAAAPGALGQRVQRRLRDQHDADEPDGGEEHVRTEVGDQRADRLADRPADDAAGLGDALDREALRAAGDVEDAERRRARRTSSRRPAARARRPGARESNATPIATQDERHDVAGETGDRADQPVDAVAEDAGDVEVDAGGEDDPARRSAAGRRTRAPGRRSPA